MDGEGVRLVAPCLELLPGYEAALEAGWSWDEARDVSREQLALVRRDRAGFIARPPAPAPEQRLPDGTIAPALPFRLFWISDGEFSGIINLRWQPGTDELPAHLAGHAGYAIVPWKRRRGYATAALRLLLPVAREAGIARLTLACDRANEASRRTILANGGVLVGERSYHWHRGAPMLLYAIVL